MCVRIKAEMKDFNKIRNVTKRYLNKLSQNPPQGDFSPFLQHL